MVPWPYLRNIVAIYWTHLGIVAENIRHYRSFRPARLIVSMISSTFSLKPRFSIWSASSRIAYFKPVKSKLPRFM